MLISILFAEGWHNRQFSKHWCIFLLHKIYLRLESLIKISNNSIIVSTQRLFLVATTFAFQPVAARVYTYPFFVSVRITLHARGGISSFYITVYIIARNKINSSSKTFYSLQHVYMVSLYTMYAFLYYVVHGKNKKMSFDNYA